MFGLGGTEILIICVVALIVIGPQKLPEMLRSLGKGVAEFKRVGNDVKSTLDDEVQKAEAETRKKEVEAELARRKEEKAAAEAAATAEPAPEATSEPETSVADAAETTDAVDKKTDDTKA